MGTPGFLAGLASETERERDAARQDKVAGRERQASLIEAEINAIYNSNASPEQKQAAFSDARKRLSALYAPEEGRDLLSRILHIGQKNKPAGPMRETLGIPDDLQQHAGQKVWPGMTLEDVLAMSGGQPTTTLTPEEQRDADLIAKGLKPRATAPKENKLEDYVAEWEKITGKKMTPEQKLHTLDILSGVEAKPSDKPAKPLELAKGTTGLVEDPETNQFYSESDLKAGRVPKDKATQVSQLLEGQQREANQKALDEARKNAEILARAVQLGDIRSQQKARSDFANLTKRAVAGHAYLKSTEQEVAEAGKTKDQTGTIAGDRLIVEGYMQLMFGIDPKALRGSPTFMASMLKAGGVDDRTISLYNGLRTGASLNQSVREQYLDAAKRQIQSWDYAVAAQASLNPDDPIISKEAANYATSIATQDSGEKQSKKRVVTSGQ
jgi:hypothetical protein